jgi:hypothetical protein
MPIRVALTLSSAQKLIRWYDEQLLWETPILRSTALGWLFGLFGQAAVTIKKTIYLTRNAPADLTSRSGLALIGHEMYHVVQQRQMGWCGFLLRYLWHWRPKHITRGEEHPLEKPAYDRQREIEQALSG